MFCVQSINGQVNIWDRMHFYWTCKDYRHNYHHKNNLRPFTCIVMCGLILPNNIVCIRNHKFLIILIKNYFVAALPLSFDNIAFYFLHFENMPFWFLYFFSSWQQQNKFACHYIFPDVPNEMSVLTCVLHVLCFNRGNPICLTLTYLTEILVYNTVFVNWQNGYWKSTSFWQWEYTYYEPTYKYYFDH